MSAKAPPPVWWILLSSLGPCVPMGHGWRQQDCVRCLCWTWWRGRMGGLGVKNVWLKVVPAVEEVLFPPEVMRSRTDSVLLLLVTVFMPGETFLIEGYDNLWALMIGLLGKHKISLIRVFPASNKDQSLSLKGSSELCISAQVRYYTKCFSTCGICILEIFKDGN